MQQLRNFMIWMKVKSVFVHRQTSCLVLKVHFHQIILEHSCIIYIERGLSFQIFKILKSLKKSLNPLFFSFCKFYQLFSYFFFFLRGPFHYGREKIKNTYVVEKKRMKNLKPFLASNRDLSPSRSERGTDPCLVPLSILFPYFS